MAEEQQELRHVNWGEVFSFTQIFKSFRMAIHPSKLLLAAAALILVFALGWALNGIWMLAGARVPTDAVARHAATSDSAYGAHVADWKAKRPEDVAALRVKVAASSNEQADFITIFTKLAPDGGKEFSDAFNEKKEKPAQPASTDLVTYMEAAKKDWSRELGLAQADLDTVYDRISRTIESAYEARRAAIAQSAADAQSAAYEALGGHYRAARQALTRLKQDYAETIHKIRGVAPGEAFFAFERDCIARGMWAACQGNFLGGLDRYRALRAGRDIRPAAVLPEDASALVPPGPAQDAGFVYWALMFVEGWAWLFSEHWLWALIFAFGALAVWAVFGGAIHRIAALHASRDEKISMGQALRFSVSKFFGFFTAPLIPLGVIFGLGVLLMIGGAIGNIPGFGPVFIGLMMFLAILLGLVIAFVLLGLVTGFGLMYPTIAVEGSDSFDATSRSFAYVLSQPWRALLYSVIAVVYGALSYLFVRLFAWAVLAVTHFFASVLLWGGTDVGGDSKLDVMWTAPTYWSLHGPFSWMAMGWGEAIGAVFIWIWTGLIAAVVLGFLLSFGSSTATVIYLLLRRKVDATDLDDVYVEEPAEPSPAPAPTTEAPIQATPADQPPPPQPPPAEGGQQAQ